MGMVVGPSGVGKSIALHEYVRKSASPSRTSVPACVAITISSGTTPRQLAEDLLISLYQEPSALTQARHKLVGEVAKVILEENVQAIFVDNADQLTAKGLGLLRDLFGETGCPIIVVGLQRLGQVVAQDEKFASCVGLYLEFLPPDEDEVIQTILPQLVLPRWSFNSTSRADKRLGKDLWAATYPSLRHLCFVLQNASWFAELQNQPRITREHLKCGLQMTPNSSVLGRSDNPL